jgi:hypothetical protein
VSTVVLCLPLVFLYVYELSRLLCNFHSGHDSYNNIKLDLVTLASYVFACTYGLYFGTDEAR